MGFQKGNTRPLPKAWSRTYNIKKGGYQPKHHDIRCAPVHQLSLALTLLAYRWTDMGHGAGGWHMAWNMTEAAGVLSRQLAQAHSIHISFCISA